MISYFVIAKHIHYTISRTRAAFRLRMRKAGARRDFMRCGASVPAYLSTRLIEAASRRVIIGPINSPWVATRTVHDGAAISFTLVWARLPFRRWLDDDAWAFVRTPVCLLSELTRPMRCVCSGRRNASHVSFTVYPADINDAARLENTVGI